MKMILLEKDKEKKRESKQKKNKPKNTFYVGKLVFKHSWVNFFQTFLWYNNHH